MRSPELGRNPCRGVERADAVPLAGVIADLGATLLSRYGGRRRRTLRLRWAR
jgi:hypothetical protein